MGQTEYNTEVLADSPQLFWKCDEPSGLLQDSSGNGRHATTGADFLYQQGAPFSGAQSVKSTTSTSIMIINVFNTSTTNVTLEFWAKAEANSFNDTNVYGVYNGNIGVNGYGWRLGNLNIPANDRLQSSSSAIDTTLNISGSRSCDSWRHVCLRRGATSWTTFRDGVPCDTDVSTATITTPTGNFGLDKSGSTPSSYFVSNVALYNTELSNARILAHYEAAIGFTRKQYANISPWRL